MAGHLAQRVVLALVELRRSVQRDAEGNGGQLGGEQSGGRGPRDVHVEMLDSALAEMIGQPAGGRALGQRSHPASDAGGARVGEHGHKTGLPQRRQGKFSHSRRSVSTRDSERKYDVWFCSTRASSSTLCAAFARVKREGMDLMTERPQLPYLFADEGVADLPIAVEK